MRRLTYDVAVSLDGYIAGPGEDISAFPMGDHVDAYLTRLQGYDTVVMGRKTYEFGYRFGMSPGDRPYPHMATHVFSRSLELPEGCGVEVVRDGWLETIDRLKAGEGTDIYLCGGAAFAGLLLAEGRVDRLILKLNPILLGGGTPLAEGFTGSQALRLEASTPYVSGVVLLEYEVGPFA